MQPAVTEESRAMESSLLPHSAHDDENIVDISPLVSGKSNVTWSFALGIFVTCCSTFAYGCVIGYSAPTQAGIMKDLKLSSAEFSFFGSIHIIGGIAGAVISGKLVDLIGRKGTMWILNVLSTIGWLAIAFAQHAWVLDLGRLLQGITLGVGSYLGPIYVSEITPSNLRGAVASLTQTMAGIGISILFLIGTLINWRVLALMGTIPCLISLPLLFFIPESPRWLAKIGKVKEFKEALQALRGQRVDVSDEAAEILEYTESLEHVSEGRFLDLFQRRYANSVMIGIVLISLPQLGGLSGYVLYTGAIFESAGVSSRVGFTASSAFQILGCIVGTAIVDTGGRRPLLLVSQTLLFMSCLVTASSFFLQEFQWWETITPVLALVSVLVNIKPQTHKLVSQ